MFPLSKRMGQDRNFRGVGPCHVTKRFLAASSSDLDASRDILVGSGTKLVLWRGEGTKGYSSQFRHLEFTNAYAASCETSVSKNNNGNGFIDANDIAFADATPTVDEMDDLYGAMQYIYAKNTHTRTQLDISEDQLVQATRRSSLVRETYSVIAVGDTYEALANNALMGNDKVIADMIRRGNNTKSLSWCVRLRQYAIDMDDHKNARFGVSKRSSMKKEREAIAELKPLLEEFTGPVELRNPECALYVFEGLNHANKVLVRKLESGASTQSISPKFRRCVTRTPLCPLASFIMCNLGRVKEGDRVMDPYSGSCSTLLASAMIAPTSQSVGIEIAGDDVVNRERIYEDFESRGLRSPVQLIHGDCTDDVIRNIALNAVGKQAFDVILADPPYGRREKASKNQKPPLVQLIECMGADLQRGEPLLRRGGRLVAFVPTNEGEDVNDGLPSQADLDKAGLEMTSLTEQPLSETLSRWLAVFYYKRSVDLNIS